jgi:hypothetical protein
LKNLKFERSNVIVDELDPSNDLDQSNRIKRRIAHGVYRIARDRKDIGEELWGIFAMMKGGYRLMTEIDLTYPVRNQQRARIDLDDDWNTRAMWVQIDANGTRRFADYVLDEGLIDVRVFEQPLPYAESQKSKSQIDRLRETIPPKQVWSEQFVKTTSTFVDFGSTMLNFAHLRQLKLKEGESIEMQALVATQPSLEPVQLKQTFTYVRDEKITTTYLDAHISSRRYTIVEHALNNPPTTTLWTDHRGIALRQEVRLDGHAHGCELTSYRWNEEEVG